MLVLNPPQSPGRRDLDHWVPIAARVATTAISLAERGAKPSEARI